MQKKKGSSGWLAIILAGAICLPGGLSVYAEPGETFPTEQSVYEESTAADPPADVSMEPTEPVSPIEPVEPPVVESSDDVPTDYDIPTEPSAIEYPPEPSYEPLDEPSFVPSYEQPDTLDEPYTPPAQPSYVWHDHTVSHEYDDNDPYRYTQEVYGEDDDSDNEGTDGEANATDEESYAPPRDTSALDISDYELSDVETLTSRDWEELKRAQQETSHFEMDPTPTTQKSGAFERLKQDGRGGNDDWLYLAWGIGLIVLGVAAIVAVVLTSRYTKRKKR